MKQGFTYHRLVLLTVICLFGFFGKLEAQILTFEFSALAGSEVTATSNTNNAGLTSSTISRGAGLSASGNTGRFNATGWAVTSIANAVSGNNYMEFTITPTSGNQFSISSIVIQLQRSATGPSALALRSSVDAYATNLDDQKSVTDNTTTQSFTFTFNQSNSTTAVTYRLYAFAEAAGGSGGPGDGTGNDIVVNGVVSAAGTPTISASTLNLSGFSAVTGSNSSSQNFTVRATNVTERVVLTAPTGFQVSRDNATFQDTVHTAFVVDSVPTQTIHVRQNSATLGATSGNISCTSAGATTVNVALTGVVLSTQPGTQPSLTIGAVTASTIELTVGNTGGLSNWIIVAKEGSAVDGVPADGTDYTANATFSSGAIIATNNRVVLKGTGTSVTVTVPSPASTYHFAVYAYNDGGVAASTNYHETTPGTANATTLSVPLGWQINATNSLFTIGFDATTDNVNNGSFAAATTFGASNPAAGQLNSNAWAYSANTAGASSFGGSLSTGNGVSVGGIGTSGGVFAYEVSTGNIALGVQPTGSVFTTGGNLTLRVQNKTGATLNNVQLSYMLWVNNNEARSTIIAFSHSTDNSTYTAASDASYTSAPASQGSTIWIPQFFSVSLTGLNIAADGFMYLRWSGTDNGGSGSRDEFAIDNISFIAERSSATLATSGNFANVLVDGNVSISAASSISETLNLKSGELSTGGNLTLKSTSTTATANVVGGTNASISGNVTVERYLPWLSADNDGFRFVGHSLRNNPVLNTITNLPAGNNTVIRYDEAANSGSGAYIGLNDRTGTWSQAEALGIWTNSVTTLSYTGELQLSDVGPVNLSNTGSGWLYVANPFPSVVDYNEVTRNNVNNAKYRWVKDNTGQGNGNWGSYVGGVGSNGGSRKIAPGQGFMVKTTGNGSASISFPASSRTTSDTVTFVRTANTGDIFRAAINKNSNNTGMETVIRFHASATNTFDEALDAYFLTDFANSSADLYTLDAQGNKYSINSLPELPTQSFMLPLYLEAFEAGNYQWSFDDSEMLSTSLIQLEDTKTGQVQTVGAGQVYALSFAANDAVNRFRLHFNGMTTSVAANNLDLIQMYAHEGALHIRGTARAESLRILDISGRTVYSVQQLELDGNAIRPNLAKGTYLVQLVNEVGVKTVKVIF